MPSPFPGMDPFIESQAWEEFHTAAAVVMAEILNPRLGDRYVARIERRVYIEHPGDLDEEVVIRDVAIAGRSRQSAGPIATEADGVAAPVTCLIAMPEERRETYLVIKDLESSKIITVIELLSPSNKRRGSGREEYLAKREEVLQSSTHLVEFDLLRGGTRMPMHSPIPPGDYYAIVSNARQRPRSDVYARKLQDRLPMIPLPLAKNDPDILLDLQNVIDTVYDRAKYHLILDYAAPLLPPPVDQTQSWITQQLAAAKIAAIQRPESSA